MKFSFVNLTKQKGLAQIPIILGLLLMAIAIPVATKLSQQEQDTRDKATCNEGSTRCSGGNMELCQGGTFYYLSHCPSGECADSSNCKASGGCSYQIHEAVSGCGGGGCSASQKSFRITKTDCSTGYQCLNDSSCDVPGVCVPDCGLNFTRCKGEKFDGGCGMDKPCTGTKDCSQCPEEVLAEGCGLDSCADNYYGIRRKDTNCQVHLTCTLDEVKCPITPTATTAPDKCVVSKYECSNNVLWKCVRTAGVADWQLIQDCNANSATCSVDSDRFAGSCEGGSLLPTAAPAKKPPGFSMLLDLLIKDAYAADVGLAHICGSKQTNASGSCNWNSDGQSWFSWSCAEFDANCGTSNSGCVKEGINFKCGSKQCCVAFYEQNKSADTCECVGVASWPGCSGNERDNEICFGGDVYKCKPIGTYGKYEWKKIETCAGTCTENSNGSVVCSPTCEFDGSKYLPGKSVCGKKSLWGLLYKCDEDEKCTCTSSGWTKLTCVNGCSDGNCIDLYAGCLGAGKTTSDPNKCCGGKYKKGVAVGSWECTCDPSGSIVSDPAICCDSEYIKEAVGTYRCGCGKTGSIVGDPDYCCDGRSVGLGNGLWKCGCADSGSIVSDPANCCSKEYVKEGVGVYKCGCNGYGVVTSDPSTCCDDNISKTDVGLWTCGCDDVGIVTEDPATCCSGNYTKEGVSTYKCGPDDSLPTPTSKPKPTGNPPIVLTPTPDPNVTPPPGGGDGECTYDSLQAQVQSDTTKDWRSQMAVQAGDIISVGCMHDGSGQLAQNVKIVAMHSDGSQEVFDTNLKQAWEISKNSGAYTIYCQSKDPNCGGLMSTVDATLNVGGVCKECPSTFRCYGHPDYGYEWFVTGYVMDGFGLAVDQYCIEVGKVKPEWIGKGSGDANCDGKLDVADSALWRNEFADISQGDKVYREDWEADFTGTDGVCDGYVDLGDYSLWRARFSQYNGGNN